MFDFEETKVDGLGDTQSDSVSGEAHHLTRKNSAEASNEFLDAMDDTFQRHMENMDIDFQEGDIVRGIVRRIEKSGVFIDISHKSEGFVANPEFSADPHEDPADVVSVGDEVNVMIVKLESKEGYTVLSRKRAEFELGWSALSRAVKNREPLTVRVTSKVDGGLVVVFSGIKGFIPVSQLSKEMEGNLDQHVGTDLEVGVLQVDRKRRKIIFSTKIIRPKTHREDMLRILESIEAGQVKEGRVTSIKDFGAFVDIGGVEGLVHISEMSWSRIAHPSDILEPGQTINVFVLGVDRENSKVSLGMKQLESDPWASASDKYSVGDVVEGDITRLVAFGAFVRLEANLEGLVHISELSPHRVSQVSDVVRIGDRVRVKIIKLIPNEQRIGLSIKALAQPEEVAPLASDVSAE